MRRRGKACAWNGPNRPCAARRRRGARPGHEGSGDLRERPEHRPGLRGQHVGPGAGIGEGGGGRRGEARDWGGGRRGAASKARLRRGERERPVRVVPAGREEKEGKGPTTERGKGGATLGPRHSPDPTPPAASSAARRLHLLLTHFRFAPARRPHAEAAGRRSPNPYSAPPLAGRDELHIPANPARERDVTSASSLARPSRHQEGAASGGKAGREMAAVPTLSVRALP